MLTLAIPLLLLQVTAAEDLALARRIDAYVAPYLEAGHVSGQLLVARGDTILVERNYGFADPSWNQAVDSTTRFAIASITKPLTQIALSRLQDEGRLSLADTLTKWLPQFPRADELRVVDLANHTAGVPHRVMSDVDEFVPRTAAEMVELVMRKGLEPNPQAERRYSSAGYAVLARVLELASGEEYGALMQRLVFAPVQATCTQHPTPRSFIPNRAVALSWSPGGMRRGLPKDLSFLVGGGSIYSTARDLLAILRGLVDGVYGATSQANVVRGRERFGWNGSSANYRAFVEYDAKQRLAWIYVTNLETGFADRLRDAVPRLVAGEAVTDPPIPSPAITTSEVGEFCELNGRYTLPTGTVLDLRCEGADLFANDWQLFPLGGLRFFSVQDYGTVAFFRDESGQITRMDWDWAGSGEIFSAPRAAQLQSTER